MSPALAGRFFTAEPPGKPPFQSLERLCPPVNIAWTRVRLLEPFPPHPAETMRALFQVQRLHSRLAHLPVRGLQEPRRALGHIRDDWHPGHRAERTRTLVPLVQSQKH